VKSSDVRLGGAIITNPAKPFWPDEGLTKLDLAKFYARIASQILPWMKGRAVTMERCPEGVRASCFYQKRAPHNLPDAVPVVSIAAPSIGDLNHDGHLDIVVSTFDHGLDVYRVPGSKARRAPWPTGRGNLLRSGS